MKESGPRWSPRRGPGRGRAPRGRRASCGNFRGVGQHSLHLCRGEAPPPRLDEDARKPADHLPEEVGADNPKRRSAPRGNDLRPVDLHLRGEVLVDPLVGEGAEIVEAPENFGRDLHPAQIERVLDPPDIALSEGRPAAGDQVEIAPPEGHVAGGGSPRAPLPP